jgi:AsmA protein
MIRGVGLFLFEVLVACVLAVAAGLFWASHYVDTEEFRLRLTALAEELVGRPVTFGEVDIVLYPMPSFEISGLAVADNDAFGSAPLAEIDTLYVSVRLFPLFSGRVEIPSLLVHGMRAHVECSEQGTINWTSLLDAERAQDFSSVDGAFGIEKVSVDEVEVVGASVTYADRRDGLQLALSGITLRTGGVHAGQRVPFVASSSFSWSDGGIESQLVLKGMILAREDWSGFALEDASVSATVGGRFLPRGASPGELVARLVVDLDKGTVGLDGLRMRFLGMLAEGTLQSGDLSSAPGVTGRIEVQPFVPAAVISRYYPKVPVAKVDGLRRAAFAASLAIDGKGVSLTDMTVHLDDLTLRGRAGLKGFDEHRYEFDLHGDTLDLDRYLPLVMTDEPFVWGDFHLDMFRAMRGKGSVQMKHLTLLGTRYSDVSLALNADAGPVQLDGAATDPDGLKLGAKARIVLGHDGAAKHPTLALRGEIEARSRVSGFAALNASRLRLTGEGTLLAQVEIPAMVCPPAVRSIGILRSATGKGTLRFGKGSGSFGDGDGKTRVFDFSQIEATLAAKALAGGKDDNYGFTVTAGVQGRGVKPGQTLSLTASGPFFTGADSPYAQSSRLAVTGQVSGPLYFGRHDAVSLSAALAFDTRSHTLALSGGVMNALNTDIRGDIRVTDLDKRFKATGNVSIPAANPSRIIRLLSDKTIATRDPEALQKASLSTRFTLRDDGFTLDDVNAELDGMKIKANVIGAAPLSDPMLSFAFTAGALDIDRYLPPPLTDAERRSGTVTKAPPVDLPLNFLRALRLSGKGWFEEFKLGKVRARQFSGQISADKGIIRVHEAKGTLHEGTLEGQISGQVGKDSLFTQLRLQVRQMQAGLLMEDMAGRDYVRGTTEVDIDLKSSGRTDDDILANLNGSARVQIRNGSFKFTGYDAKPSATDSSRAGQVANDPRTRRTVFSKAVSEFAVDKGVFTVTDFRIEAPPALQSTGTGNFSLPDNTINLAVRNDFVAVPSLTIEIVGKLSDPEVRVPKGKILNDTVRNILSLPEKSFNFLRDLFR